MWLVAEPVPSLLSGRAVVADAVGLDHQAQVRPVEVDLEAVHPHPGLRRRQPGRARQRQEEALEVGVGEDEREAVEHAPQRRHARPGADPVEGRTELLRVHEVETVGLVDRGLERPPRATVLHAERHRDVDGPRGRPADPPQGGRGSVAERGLGTAAKDGREPASMRGERRPPDGVDAAPHPVEPTAFEAVLDRVGVKAQREQLAARNNPMLAPHQLPHRRRLNDLGVYEPLMVQPMEARPPAGSSSSERTPVCWRAWARRTRTIPGC